ncbi:MAG: hypothetical protein HRT71_01545 [Flavobacteriales bacterium]|nr:hypothetical protein [Flavobacteriales bacterium]
MKEIKLLAIAIFGLAISSYAGEEVKEAKTDTMKTNQVQISFIYPLGTNGVDAINIVDQVSLNIFAGINGGVDGLQLAGFSNMIKGDVKGIQLSGFLNANAGETTGFQGAGFLNVNRRKTTGVQAAGFANAVAADVNGAQFAGFLNATNGKVKGHQFAGFVNVVGDSIKGIQAAGFVNIAVQNVKGIQAAGFANLAKDVEGAQLSGFINVAKKLKGVQIGFINFADSVESGLAIGFLSIARNGYFALDVTANETYIANLQFKVGHDRFYNIFGLSGTPNGDQFALGYGYGVGTTWTAYTKLKMNLDLMAYAVTNDKLWNDDVNMINKLQLGVGLPLGEKIIVHIDPSINVQVQYNQYGEFDPLDDISPYSFVEQTSDDGNTKVKLWAGVSAGIRF